MGCVASEPKDVEDIDREVLANFLQNKENLKTIWKQFNKHEDDVLDRGQFDRLLSSALQIFCKERDPDMPPPTHENLQPFVEKLRSELAPRIDVDGDGVISFDEFKSFGEYLKTEYRKLQTKSTMKLIGTDDNGNVTHGADDLGNVTHVSTDVDRSTNRSVAVVSDGGITAANGIGASTRVDRGAGYSTTTITDASFANNDVTITNNDNATQKINS